MMQSVLVGEVRRLGDRAFLIGTADPASGRALAGALEQALAEAGGVEVVCRFMTVAVLLTEPDADLVPIGYDEADAAWRASRRVIGRYPLSAG